MTQPQLRPVLLTGATDFRARARAIGKVALYLLIAFLSALLLSAVLKAATGQTLQELMRSGPANALLAHTALLLALVIVPTAISLRLWREPFAWSGWSPAGVGRLAAIGLGSGATLMGLIIFILWAAGAWSGVMGDVSWGQLLEIALLSALLWLTQAAHEEGLHRGYAFVQLSRAISFWPAAAILSFWFIWGHFGNEGATTVSLAVAGLFALVLAYSLLRTGSLWFALGFHASWNFTQSFVFGLYNSGSGSRDALMVSQVQGSPLLTGGSAGPEGSVLSLGAIMMLAVLVHFGLPQRDLSGRAIRS
ncbi:CPBP family intramembrane glutamic endopeptidase [Sphingomonas sp. LT1P40]|uniref:CPBP family intramembrane glutamic endopeptidase n=1 Tax=Alteristakelama amylovorans TaxID=3096166 RepID=UPI002FC70DB6